MKHRLVIAVLVMGLSGIVAQIFLLREFLIVLSGNEFSIGIILANWLLLEAFGSFFLGKRIERASRKLEAFSVVTTVFSISLLAAIFAVRILKSLIGVSIGETIGLVQILVASFLILLPVSMLHGALFTFSCEIASSISGNKIFSAGRVYGYETVGTVIGGVVATYFLIPHFDSFEVASALGLVNILVCLGLLSGSWADLRSKPRIRHILVFLTVVFMVITSQAHRVHHLSINLQWRNLDVVHWQNSQYGNICVVENQGQYIFFEDGVASLITPIPDIPFVEEFVDIPLLAHQRPKRLLILSGGAGGIINEALKHPSIEAIDYAELDPLLIDLIRMFPTPLTERELGDQRVKVSHIDGRLFTKKTDNKYDVILLGITEPSNLQTNRFFTKEFFSLAKARLSEGGILVLGLPGSLTYLNQELIDLNSCIFHTLALVFQHIRVIPGGGVNIFLASDSPTIRDLTKQDLIQEVRARNLATETLIPRNIEEKLHQGWQHWFLDLIKDSSKRINSDFKPIAVFYSISYWSALFAPWTRWGFRQAQRLDVGKVIISFLVLFAAFLLYSQLARTGSKKLRAKSIGIPLAIMTTGFAGMIFDLVLIFAFQSINGYVFSWIGLLVASFMAGAALGAMLSCRIVQSTKPCFKLFVAAEVGVACFSFACLTAFLLIHEHLALSDRTSFSNFLFLVASSIGGLLVGLEFPLANHLFLSERRSVAKSAGLLYASDLIGGWFGGILGAVLLLPVLGLSGTCIAVSLLKLLSLIIIFHESSLYRRKGEIGEKI